jgi:hypothetical protein
MGSQATRVERAMHHTSAEGAVAMLFVITVLGALGAIVLGLVGLARGDAGELERILAIACIAMAAAGVVGLWSRTPGLSTSPSHVEPRRVAISLGDLFSAIAIAPVVALCAGVFLLTLIPSIYVSLPVLAIWWLGSEERRARHVEHVPGPAELPEPAVV